MRCKNCGADIPEGMLICPDCRTEVQMVPDYNPLDDVITRDVKEYVKDATRPIQSDEMRRYRQNRTQQGEYGNSTRVMSQTELDSIRARRVNSNTTSRMRQTGSVRRTTDPGSDERERRKRQAEKKRQLAKRRRRNVLLTFLLIVAAVGVSAYLIYQNSYAGILKKAESAFASGDYSAAENYYNRAISKAPDKTDAYTGLAEVYIQQDDLDQAERVYLSAIDSQPENADLYEAAIKFYINTDQADQIAAILDGCSQSVLDQVSEYVSDMPVFSLEEGTYSLEQEVTLTAEGDIYYTTDGSEPTQSSTKYTEPILLKEGTVVVKAICINEKGVPSLVATRTYTVEIPAIDAPAVTPSTGQYDTATQITINVPDGYTAYYTTDGTTPSTASAQYTGPIDMPEGQTIFSAILVSNSSGKASQVTKRNYVLQY